MSHPLLSRALPHLDHVHPGSMVSVFNEHVGCVSAHHSNEALQMNQMALTHAHMWNPGQVTVMAEWWQLQQQQQQVR